MSPSPLPLICIDCSANINHPQLPGYFPATNFEAPSLPSVTLVSFFSLCPLRRLLSLPFHSMICKIHVLTPLLSLPCRVLRLLHQGPLPRLRYPAPPTSLLTPSRASDSEKTWMQTFFVHSGCPFSYEPPPPGSSSSRKKLSYTRLSGTVRVDLKPGQDNPSGEPHSSLLPPPIPFLRS